MPVPWARSDNVLLNYAEEPELRLPIVALPSEAIGPKKSWWLPRTAPVAGSRVSTHDLTVGDKLTPLAGQHSSARQVGIIAELSEETYKSCTSIP